jgi:hypothetical protein
MEGRACSDGFEASFVVAISREQAWDRLAGAVPAFEGLGAPRPGQWWIPAIEAPADEIEARPKELLRTRKAVEPCKGTEIAITLADADTGTRITIVQTGFGTGFTERRVWLESGWHAILADFVVFFGRGVSLGRHATWWSSIGCGVVETDEGLAVTDVQRDGFAGRAGMRPGDLILQLAGAPVLNVRDLSILVRGPLHAGTETTARYLRGAQILTGVATI